MISDQTVFWLTNCENAKIDNKVNAKQVQLVEKKRVIKQYIDREVIKYDNTCIIPNEFIEAHNKAARK